MRGKQRSSFIGFRLGREKSRRFFFLRATTLAPLRSLKAVRQSFGPGEQGAQPAPSYSRIQFLSASLLVRVDGAASVCVCQST